MYHKIFWQEVYSAPEIFTGAGQKLRHREYQKNTGDVSSRANHQQTQSCTRLPRTTETETEIETTTRTETETETENIEGKERMKTYKADDSVGQLKLSIALHLIPNLPPIPHNEYRLISCPVD